MARNGLSVQIWDSHYAFIEILISCSFLCTSESHSSLCTISPFYLEFASSSSHTPSPSSMHLQWCWLGTFFATSGAGRLRHGYCSVPIARSPSRILIYFLGLLLPSTLNCKLHQSRALCFLFTSAQNSCRHSTTMDE